MPQSWPATAAGEVDIAPFGAGGAEMPGRQNAQAFGVTK